VRAALETVQFEPAIAPPAPATAHNLPLQLTRFIGRERELAEVTPLLAAERLVTLTGAGGAGKTRLALHVAEDLVREFQHGVWLIELAPVGDPDLLPHTIASTLGLRHETGQPLTDALTDFLRPRATLLLLDNCEHLIAACAALVSQVLRACPRVRILATSREGLGIAGERAWRVPSLSLPDVKLGVPADLAARSDAVRFFVDRAQTVAPHFVLSPDTTPTVARICHRLDGIPLALELAAARMRVLSLEQISARIDDRFQLLTGGSRTAVPRQQTLRATIDWSYDLLSDGERRLLRGLSVFAGGCSLEAAEQVCGRDGASDTIDLLSHLIDKSLVAVDDDSADGRRYRLMETVRQYARDRLFESGEAAALRDRHFRFFYRLALDAKPELPRPNLEASVRQLDADHDNLRAALEWCLTTPGNAETSLRLVGALWRFWIRRCYFAEGRQWVERALAAGSGAPRSLRAKALVAAADCSYFQGDYAAVQLFSEEVVALDELERLDEERWLVGFALFILGILQIERREPAQATVLAERSLAIAQAVGPPWLSSLALTLHAYAARQTADYERARALMEEALAVVRPLDDKFVMATLLFNVGDVALRQGQHEQATVAAREGLVLSKELADARGMTWCLVPLAAVAAVRRQLQRAARLWGAIEGLSQSVGSPVPPYILESKDVHLPAVLQSLGDEGFGAAWAEGRQMTPDAVVAYALRDDRAE
jgi:non-specific serine/threonine protein kinase